MIECCIPSIQALIAGDYNEALGYYDRSLIFEPTTAVHNNRALLCKCFIRDNNIILERLFTDLKQRKWKLSVKDCNRVLEKEPENIKGEWKLNYHL